MVDEPQRYNGSSSSVLTLFNVQELDEGDYRCVIDNYLISQAAELSVCKFKEYIISQVATSCY